LCECLMLDISEVPLGLVCLGEPPIGGTAFPARGMPCGLFGSG